MVNDAAVRNAASHPNAKQKLKAIAELLSHRLERFSMAIDMLAQSSPQVMGLSLIGLLWGSFRFFLVVSILNGKTSKALD